MERCSCGELIAHGWELASGDWPASGAEGSSSTYWLWLCHVGKVHQSLCLKFHIQESEAGAPTSQLLRDCLCACFGDSL